MAIRKIGNYWYTYYKVNGKLITRATGTMCKSEAEMIDKALKKELQARRKAAKFNGAVKAAGVANALADEITQTRTKGVKKVKGKAGRLPASLSAFIRQWSDRKCEERSECHTFWIELLHVFSSHLHVDYDPLRDIWFERQVKISGDHPCYIDLYLRSSKTLIEQKGSSVSLDREVLQQAARYAAHIDGEDKPERIVLCNFKRFKVYRYPDLTLESEFCLKDIAAKWASIVFMLAHCRLAA